MTAAPAPHDLRPKRQENSMARRMALVLMGLVLVLGGASLCTETGGTNSWCRVCLFPAVFRADCLVWGDGLNSRDTISAGRRGDCACAGHPGASG